MTYSSRRLALAAAAAASLLGAGCELGGGGTVGELGNGRFFYQCVVPDDLFCSEFNPDPPVDVSEPAEVPDAMVLGSAFALEFDVETTDDEGGSFSADVECAVDGFEEQQHFRPSREGWFAFVAERSDGAVVDLLHVLVTTPERIDIAGNGLSAGDTIAIAGPTDVAAIPYGGSGQILFGGFPATWTTSDDEVVAVESSSVPGAPPTGALARLVPTGTGDALVTVTIAGVVREFQVAATDGLTP
jgi:hypothetical protein